MPWKTAPEQTQYELGIVSYPGQGKYNNCLYIPYHDLPDVEEVATEEQLQVTSPPGQGWWPVIALQIVAEPRGSVGLETKAKKVIVVCWYQLLSEGTVIAWWIYI